jgi:decaprenyl-phosphate phosphoribosyltransferase
VLGVVRALRPRQWTKNVLVFVAPAAAGVLVHPFQLGRTVAAFWIMCATASGVYLVNDTIDAEADRLHPEKCRRPVAAGVVPPRLALGVAAVLLVVGVASAWALAGWEMLAVVGLYAAIGISYTLYLKREPVIEMVAVASGFVLRAIAGGVATHVPLSSWLLVVTSFGALFVVVGKRASERRLLGQDRSQHRPVLASYTETFLTSTLILTAGVTVTAYCLWAFERTGLMSRAGHHFIWIQLTVVPVVVGLLLVLRLIDAGDGGAPEELVLRERSLQVLAVLWVVLFAVGIYG